MKLMVICLILVGIGILAASVLGSRAELKSVQAQASTQGKKLKPTPPQVPGPYFLPNSPLRNKMFPAGMQGQELKISGQVLAEDGTAIADATVHVWVADPNGVYDNQDKQGNPVNIPVAKQTLRGRVITDAQGNYSFNCLRPGNYELEDGKWRPAHIHIKVEAKGYKTLITQLYFVDDQFNEKDLPGPLFFQKELLVPLTPATAQAGVVQDGTFNFVLAK